MWQLRKGMNRIQTWRLKKALHMPMNQEGDRYYKWLNLSHETWRQLLALQRRWMMAGWRGQGTGRPWPGNPVRHRWWQSSTFQSGVRDKISADHETESFWELCQKPGILASQAALTQRFKAATCLYTRRAAPATFSQQFKVSCSWLVCETSGDWRGKVEEVGEYLQERFLNLH